MNAMVGSGDGLSVMIPAPNTVTRCTSRGSSPATTTPLIGIIALAGGRARGATNGGQATAGLICSVLALAVAIFLSVHVGSWAAHNTSTFTSFDKCIVKAHNRAAIATCMSNFANDVRG